MRKKATRYLANNALGALALFVALGGVSYAASGGFVSGGKLQACVGRNGSLTLLKPGKKCKHGQQDVAWSQTGPAGPKGATGPAGSAGQQAANATHAETATKAGEADSAATASNALSLGGVPASGYTRSDCISKTGQIKGFALIPEDVEGTFTPVKIGYNCSGEAVEARFVAQGRYEVKFDGNPATIAVATDDGNGSTEAFADAVGVRAKGGGVWEIRDKEAGTGFSEDDNVAIILP